MMWMICYIMWKGIRLILLILPLISSSFFLPNFQISNYFNSLFSGTDAYKVEFWSTHEYWVGASCILESSSWCLFIPSFLQISLQFQNIKFYHTFLWGLQSWTWYSHGQWVYLLCTPKSSSQYLFFNWTKNLHLQNCFNIPLMAMAGGIWALLTFCYICHCNWKAKMLK